MDHGAGVERPDQELVRTALQGAGPEAQAAFAVLVDRWKGPLYRFLYARVRHAQDTEDITFEAFFEAWKSLRQIRGEFRPWLFGVGWKTMASALRKRKGVKILPTPVEQALLEARPVLEDPAVRLDLAEALSLISPAMLDLLREKFLEGKSYKDLEAIHGIAASTLREHVTEASDRLGVILQQRGLLDRVLRKPGQGPLQGAPPEGGGPRG